MRALLLCVLACADRPADGAPDGAPAACAHEAVPVTPGADLPEGLLLQTQSFGPEGDPTGYRLFEDGRFERRRAGGPWEPKAPLSAAEVQRVREAIAASELAAAAGRHAHPSSPPDATRREIWVRAGGALVRIEIGDGCIVEAEQRLAAAITDVLH